jgi:LysM repeat protein
MRTDVKIGMVLSLIVVIAAGWYYLGSEPGQENVPLGDEKTLSATGPEKVAAAPDAVRRDEPRSSLRSAEPPPDGEETPRLADDSPSSEDGSKPRLLEGLLSGDEHGDDALTESTSLADLLASGQDDEEIEPAAVPGSSTSDALTAAPSAEATLARAPAESAPSRPDSTVQRRPASSAKPQPGTRTHVVGQGDTFAILAEVYYGSQRYTRRLIEANPQVTDPLRLTVGTVLNIPPIPGAVATTPAAGGRGTYVVREGDTFYGIARDMLGNANRWKELLELNSEVVQGDPHKLRPGQVLRLPESATTASR